MTDAALRRVQEFEERSRSFRARAQKIASRLIMKANKAYEMVATFLLYFESIGHVESSIEREIHRNQNNRARRSKVAAKMLLTFSTNGKASPLAT